MAHQVLPWQVPLAGHPPETEHMQDHHQGWCRVCVFIREQSFPPPCAVEGHLCQPAPCWIHTELTLLRQTFAPASCAKTVLETLSACPHSPAESPAGQPWLLHQTPEGRFTVKYSQQVKVKVKFQTLEAGAQARHRGEVASASSCCCWLLRKIQPLPALAVSHPANLRLKGGADLPRSPFHTNVIKIAKIFLRGLCISPFRVSMCVC